MKRVLQFLLVIGILAIVAWSFLFLYKKSEKPEEVFETATPLTTSIVLKTVATGSIVPREEVEIKSRVSGIVEELYVEPGNPVKKGQRIARIKIVPDMLSLNNAQTAVNTAKINYDNAKREYERYKLLYEDSVIPETQFRSFRLDLKLSEEQLESAKSNLELIRKGASKRVGEVSNIVYSTVAGMVLDVPVKEGGSVIESNTFNDGTSIATVADMGDMIFQGMVDESEVGKIREGMELQIKIGALEKERFKGVLEYISPKGLEDQGAIQFEVKAAVVLQEGFFIRAGYSANADIVLDRVDKVLAISESLLQFNGDSVFVEVETGPQQFEKRPIKVGLSDGINIEIKSGLSESDKIKKIAG